MAQSVFVIYSVHTIKKNVCRQFSVDEQWDVMDESNDRNGF